MAAKKSKKKSKVEAKKPVAKRAAKKAAPRAKKTAAKGRKPRGHAIVHWEIQSQKPAILHKFYADAFGWTIDANNPMRYGMVASKGDDGINGGIGGSEIPGSRVLVYTQVPSIDSVLDRIESVGGQTIMPRTDIGPVVMALYRDPEGNVMGLIEG